MTELLPVAVQELTATGKIHRWSRCPEHTTRSSDFVGLQQELFGASVYWVFRCRGKGVHLFKAAADPNVPPVGDAEAEEKWREQQRQRLVKGNGGQ